MSGGIKLKLDVELAAFQVNMAAYQKMTRKTSSETVRDVANMVLQTGAKEIPAAGDAMLGSSKAARAAKRGKRDVIQAVRRYRHGIEELVQGARPEAPGDKSLWLIPRPERRRPIGKTGGRRYWTFENAAAARAHATITYRGVGKAGFWSQFPSIGRKIPNTYLKHAALASVPGLKVTTVRLDDPMPFITVTNRSVAVQRLAEAKTPYILSKVTNRIAGIARANKRKYLAFKQAGGLVWTQSGSVNGESFGEYKLAEDL